MWLLSFSGSLKVGSKMDNGTECVGASTHLRIQARLPENWGGTVVTHDKMPLADWG
ncbi:hypothetical protein ACKLNO_11560 [Neisseriaceae bacterium B1]